MSFFQKPIIDNFLSKLSVRGLKILANNEINAGILKENAAGICRGYILPEYVEETLDNAFSDESFEVVALFEGESSIPISFLVVEKGECSRMDNVWSVNLICALMQSPSGIKSLGQILMGLYLYTISENDNVEEKIGVLELANGYINASGLASYSKLGFTVDYSLYGSDCFENYNNLPMIAEDIDSDKIVGILNNTSIAYEKPPICSIVDRNAQLYLGVAMNLLIFLTVTPENERKDYIIRDYGMNDGRFVNYKYLYSLIKKDVDAFSNEIQGGLSGSGSSSFPGFSKLHTKIVTSDAAPVTATTNTALENSFVPSIRSSRLTRQSYPIKSAITTRRKTNPLSVIVEASEPKFISTRETRATKRSTAKGIKKTKRKSKMKKMKKTRKTRKTRKMKHKTRKV